MPQQNPYQLYQSTYVSTADQRQLIVMLYDGAVRFLRRAVVCIHTRDYEGCHRHVLRGREIIVELLSTLRPEKGGAVGENLRQLYLYLFQRLVEANLKKDPEALGEVIRILLTLREGWVAVANETPNEKNHAERSHAEKIRAEGEGQKKKRHA